MPGCNMIGRFATLESSNELTGVQNEGLVTLGLDQASEVRLLDGGINVRVLVILEYSEPAVQAHVHAGRLDHRLVVGLKADSASGKLGLDIAVR